MPTKPKILTLTNTSADVLNVIRENGSQNYRDYVPIATANADSIRKIGGVIMDYPALQNEFLSALVNRIGRVLITSRMYSNPWAIFKKGMLEYGESVEEIFVNIAKPFTFDPEVAESQVFKREIPDVRSAFHIMNYQKFYKATISNDQLRQAFLNANGIYTLVAYIVDQMYSGASYDEFLTMKYMIARLILDGRMNPTAAGTTTTDLVKNIKKASNNLVYAKTAYNPAGVTTFTPKERQYIILTSDSDADIDVDVLAAAFNMDKVTFAGRKILVDGFNELDTARLAVLFDGDPNYEEISADDLAKLANVKAILADEDFFMIFENFRNFTEQYNGEGLYWNYWYHLWETFSTSPFANRITFSSEAMDVTNITVSPATATVTAGQSIQLTANVTATGFVDQTVTWSCNSAYASVDQTGKLTVKENAPVNTSITVTATSNYKSSVSGTAVVKTPAA